MFEGVLKVNLYTPAPFGWFAPRDEIVRMTGVEEILTDMVDRPEYVHKLSWTAGWHGWTSMRARAFWTRQRAR